MRHYTTMQKIFIERRDLPEEVAEKIMSLPDTEISLVIPTGALFKESIANFHYLRQKAEAAGKTITIESVDEEVLALAKLAHLGSIHPILRRIHGGRSLSDIVPIDPAEENSEELPRAKKQKDSQTMPPREKKRKEFVEEAPTAEAEPERYEMRRSAADEPLSPRWGRRKKVLVGVLILIVVAGGVAWGVSTWFGHATIVLGFKQSPWQATTTVMASKALSSVDTARAMIPAEVFDATRNTTYLFPASGSANVSQKATAKILVYNAYSSSPQDLVATTRFVAPDGKIFRLTNRITVPGAKITNGQIVPSSIETDVVADAAGPAYNVGPFDKLTIPGFKGTPKYDAFYGAMSAPASGGFIGERKTPTAQDITAAKQKATTVLETSLETSVLSGRPEGFVIPDGAFSFNVTKISVNMNTDDQGNFSVFAEAEYAAIGFRESDLRALLLAGAANGDATLDFKALSLSYADIKPDFTNGTLSFSSGASGTLTEAFDADQFKKNILGKNLDSARNVILALPGLTDAKISLWPFWKSTVPSRVSGISVSVE